MFIGALFVVAQPCSKQPEYLSADEWINKLWCNHRIESFAGKKEKKKKKYILQHEWILCQIKEAKLKKSAFCMILFI